MHFKGILIATLKGLGEFQRGKTGIKELQMEKVEKPGDIGLLKRFLLQAVIFSGNWKES